MRATIPAPSRRACGAIEMRSCVTAPRRAVATSTIPTDLHAAAVNGQSIVINMHDMEGPRRSCLSRRANHPNGNSGCAFGRGHRHWSRAAVERIRPACADLFRCEPPPEIAAISEFTWLRLPGGGYRLALAQAVQLCVQSDLLGRWQVRRLDPASLVPDDVVAEVESLERAVHAADSLVRREHADSMKLVHRGASWRDRSPTENQLELLRRWRLPMPSGLTHGQAGWIIAHHIAARGGTGRPHTPRSR